MKILCILGFHSWGKWHPTDYNAKKDIRVCKSCGVAEERKAV